MTAEEYTILQRFAVAMAGINDDTEQLVHDALEEKLGRNSSAETSTDRLVPLLQAIWNDRPISKNDAPVSNLPPIFQRMSAEERAATALHGMGMETLIPQVIGSTPKSPDEGLPMEKIISGMESIPVTPEMLNRFKATALTAATPFRVFSMVGFTVLFSAILLLGMIGWIWHDSTTKIDENLAKKFTATADKISDANLETVDLPIAELGDYLFLKYGMENYPVPPAFSKTRAALVGLNRIDGHPVVQIGLKDSRALLTIFRTEDFGLEPEQSNWRTATLDNWSVALRAQNGQGTALTIQGDEDALRTLLPK